MFNVEVNSKNILIIIYKGQVTLIEALILY